MVSNKKKDSNEYPLITSISFPFYDNYPSKYNRASLPVKLLIHEGSYAPLRSVINYSFKLPTHYKAEPIAEILPYWKQDITRGFDFWQNTAHLKFIENDTAPDVYVVRFFGERGSPLGFYDKASNILALNAKMDHYSAYFYPIIMHEMGHLIGLDHPFESPLTNTTHPCFNTTDFSIMNYEAGGRFYTSSATPWDINAVQFIYGKNFSSSIGDTVYHVTHFAEGTVTRSLSTLPWDAAGIDTLSAQGLNDNVTLDIRRYGLSDTENGKIWTPNIQLENVIGGTAKNHIILNELDNFVDVRDSSETNIRIDTAGCGNDQVIGFIAGRDRLILNYASTPPSYRLLDQQLPCGNTTCPAVRIELDPHQSITLLNTYSENITESTLQTRIMHPESRSTISNTCDLDEFMHFMEETPSIDNTETWSLSLISQLEYYLGELPTQLCLDFSLAFAKGAGLTFINEISFDILKRYGCTEKQCNLATIVLYSLYVIMSGSVIANSAGILTNCLFRFLGFHKETASITGRLVSGLLTCPWSTYSENLFKLSLGILGTDFGKSFAFWAKKTILPDNPTSNPLKQQYPI